MRHGALAIRGLVLGEPAIGSAQTVLERDFRLPTQSLEPGDIDDLPRRAVRLAGVVVDFAFEADDAANQSRQIRDRDLLAGAEIDDLLGGVVLGEIDDAVRRIVDIEELAQRPPTAPDLQMLGP